MSVTDLAPVSAVPMLVFEGRVKHGSTCRLIALMMPMRANNGGPSCSVTSNSTSIAACHSSASCLALDSLVMYVAASRSVTGSFPAGHRDRIDKPLIPRHEFAFAPYWCGNERI